MERFALMTSHESTGRIRAWCQSQDIVAVIGRYVALDRRGMGSCPFKGHHYRGDVRPSFQVFGGQDAHWYCHAWQRAGDLFDFLCLYYGLTPQAMWRRIRQEGWGKWLDMSMPQWHVFSRAPTPTLHRMQVIIIPASVPHQLVAP